MGRAAAADGASAPPRGPFAVDQDRALAELELAWSEGGYHGFTAAGGTWCAITSAGEVLTGARSPVFPARSRRRESRQGFRSASVPAALARSCRPDAVRAPSLPERGWSRQALCIECGRLTGRCDPHGIPRCHGSGHSGAPANLADKLRAMGLM